MLCFLLNHRTTQGPLEQQGRALPPAMKIVQVAVGRAFGVFKDNGIDCLNFSGLSTLIFISKCLVLLNINEAE